MVLDGALREEEPLRDRRVAEAFAEELQNLEFAGGELGRVIAGGRSRAARDISRPERAQAAGDHGRRCPGAEIGEQLERAPESRLGRDVRECECGLVGPSEFLPACRGRLELAKEFEPVGSICR